MGQSIEIYLPFLTSVQSWPLISIVQYAGIYFPYEVAFGHIATATCMQLKKYFTALVADMASLIASIQSGKLLAFPVIIVEAIH